MDKATDGNTRTVRAMVAKTSVENIRPLDYFNPSRVILLLFSYMNLFQLIYGLPLGASLA